MSGVTRSLEPLAPRFVEALEDVVAAMRILGHDPWIFETLRTPARQAALYARGRTVPGRIVTKASSHLRSWHGHGLAADIICRDTHWNATSAFWSDLGRACRTVGLTWGGDWRQFPDRPHVQWGRCPPGPTPADRERTQDIGMAATWAHYGADA